MYMYAIFIGRLVEIVVYTTDCMQVAESDVFERDGFDVHSSIDVSFTQAVLGGEVKAPGLSGPIMLKVTTLWLHDVYSLCVYCRYLLGYNLIIESN